jgi:hypothetical protein
MAGLSIVIDGKITSAKEALSQIKAEVKGTAAQITALGNTAPINKLNESLAETAKLARQVKNTPIDPTVSRRFTDEIIRGNRALKDMAEPAATARRNIEGIGDVAKPSMDKLKRSASGAGAALGDVSRIASDLPFGLLGISNNLSPMIESFGRLKTETGSAKAALSAMAGSLLGPAGLALGINIVTSAFLIYQNGISGFNRKTKEAKDQAEEFIKTLRTVSQVTSQSAASEEGNISKVQALARAVLDQTESYDARNRALNELKGINKEYFGDLTLEQSKLAGLSVAVEEYTKAIKAQAVVKGFTDEIGRVSVELAKQEGTLNKLRSAADQAQAALAKTPKTITSATGEDRISGAFIKAQNAAKEAEKAFKDQREIVETLGTNYGTLNGQIDAATRKLLEFKSVDDNTGREDKTDPLKKQLEYYERILNTITDVNERVAVGEKVLDLRVRLLTRDGPKQGLTAQELDATVRGFKDDFQKLLDEQAASLEFSPTLRLSQVLRVDVPDNISFFITNKGTIATKLNDEISKALGLDKKLPIATLHNTRIKLFGAKITAEIEGKEKLQKNLQSAINEAVLGLKVEGLAGLGEIIGAGLAGGAEGFKKAIQGFLGNIGSIISQLGKQIITISLQMLALKKALDVITLNPAIGIAIGIGLVALGSVLKNVSFSGPKMAEGGITTGATIAQIGEAGREAVIPLNKLPQIMGSAARGNGGGSSIGLAIRGRELVAFLMEETRQFNRNF